jgi:hypothetical protein
MKLNFVNQIFYPNVNERQSLLDILLLIENSRRNDRTNWNEVKKKFILDFIPVMTLKSSFRAKKAVYQMDYIFTDLKMKDSLNICKIFRLILSDKYVKLIVFTIM